MRELRVHYLHDRLMRPKTNDQSIPAMCHILGKLPKAVTYAYVIEKGTKNTRAVVSIGAAVCSYDDQFCRKTGREIAYDRLTDGEATNFKSVQLQTGMRVPTTAAEWRAFDRHVIDLFIQDQKAQNPVFEDVPW